MNAYLIHYKGKKYITNADNLMEAEDEFVAFLEIGYDTDGVYIVEQIEITSAYRNDDSIVFF